MCLILCLGFCWLSFFQTRHDIFSQGLFVSNSEYYTYKSIVRRQKCHCKFFCGTQGTQTYICPWRDSRLPSKAIQMTFPQERMFTVFVGVLQTSSLLSTACKRPGYPKSCKVFGPFECRPIEINAAKMDFVGRNYRFSFLGDVLIPLVTIPILLASPFCLWTCKFLVRGFQHFSPIFGIDGWLGNIFRKVYNHQPDSLSTYLEDIFQISRI